MDTVEDIERLLESGVPFSICAGPNGYVARVGNYMQGNTPRIETESLEEAIIWVRAHVAISSAPSPVSVADAQRQHWDKTHTAE
jgi:hypothetical protein